MYSKYKNKTVTTKTNFNNFNHKSGKDKTASFIKYEKQIKVPFIIYAHFEALRIPANKPSPKTKSKVVFIHEPCGFGYSIKCSYNDAFSKSEYFAGENCANVFWEKLDLEVKDINKKLKIKVPPHNLTQEKRSKFNKAELCHFCQKKLDEDKHEDYWELTGEFMGAAHKKCKEIEKIPYFVPVVMEDFSKYGAHFILRVLSDEEQKKIFSIKDGDEKYISLSRQMNKMQVRFIDSSRFLLDSKIEDLEKILEDNQKQRIKKNFKNKTEFTLMKTKGCFPYAYIKSLEQFSEKKLPDKIGFYDELHEAKVSDENYNWATNVWKTFKCKTLGDYFYLYIKSNVLLLEDIFENFRLLCLDKYQLDPAQYYTVAGLGWDAMLKYTKVNLAILQDSKMIHFIKSNIRGGINQCTKRLIKANNKYCPTFDSQKKSTFIIYLDANNLAGWAMSQYLPFSDFSWLSETEIKTIGEKIKNLKKNDDYGYIFEVDLDYPKVLHKKHNDLPFCCERLLVPPKSMHPNLPQAERSTLNLYNKKGYVIDYRNLQQCLANGLKLKKIHRVLKFKQTKWLEPYVAYNTKLRTNAKNDFEVRLYKLLNNSVYGKTIQKSSNDKPIYAGFCILELSKNLIYNFHYKHMVPKYEGRINLLYTDTDSLIYEIQTDDLYLDFRNDPKFLNLLDTSDMDPRWNMSSNKNKKVLGKMKDEGNGKIIREFFGVKSKVYCYNIDGEIIKKAIGVAKYVKENFISKEDYENCIMNDVTITKKILNTESKKHEVQTVEVTKTALSPGDIKRNILPDKINTLAWGYQE